MLFTNIKSRITINQLLWVIALTPIIGGCGSAEPIKGYRYETTKYNLEKALLKVIKNNPRIYLDTNQNKVIVKRNPGDSTDTTNDTINVSAYHGADSADIDKYNRSFVTIKIKVGEAENVYWFRYYGDEQYWNKAKSSEIFIVSAYDKNGKGLEQGQNEHGEFSSDLAEELTGLFETEFINKFWTQN